MKNKPESRSKIKEGIETRKKSIDDRAAHMANVVQEKRQIADTSRTLRLSATSEGAEAVIRAMEDAARAVHIEFQKQNKDVQSKFNDCKKAEVDLKQRTKYAENDAVQAKAVKQKLKETKKAKDPIAQAEKVATQDAVFTKEQKQRQEHNRIKSEHRRQDQKSHLISIKLW